MLANCALNIRIVTELVCLHRRRDKWNNVEVILLFEHIVIMRIMHGMWGIMHKIQEKSGSFRVMQTKITWALANAKGLGLPV